MTDPALRKRIWGWFFFDWASQPYHTVLLTFIFGPFFAAIMTAHFQSLGMEEGLADAQAQTIWARAMAIFGLIIAFTGPVFGAMADSSGRRMRWIIVFSAMYIIGSGLLWFTQPDASNLYVMIAVFGLGFIGAEYALIFVNAQLPSLGTRDEIGKVSGSGFAFGYVGGLICLALVLVFLVAQGNGKTLVGLDPIFGLDPEQKEGTRFVGPLAAIWFAVFMIPYFLWVREVAGPAIRITVGQALRNVWASIKGLFQRRSLGNYLLASMFYRDGLNGLYTFGGTYAALVLNWETTLLGIFGIISGMGAAALSFAGGRLDTRLGPKPVIIGAVWVLILVCIVIINLTNETIFGVAVPDGSNLPMIIFFICGVFIGGMGGVLQAASRSLMVRHCDPETATEYFGLYGLSGRATAFLAPALISVATATTGSTQLGVSPVILLFIAGLIFLRWVKAEGEM